MVSKIEITDLKLLRGAVVVSAGGHLEQALRRVTQLNLQSNTTFIIPKNAQSESKLSNQNHLFMANVASRDYLGLCKAIIQLIKILNKKDFDYVLSTGAGVAFACFIVCKFKRINFFYIESIARVQTPSLTGKMLALFQSSNLYTESVYFDSRKWKKIETFFSDYSLQKSLGNRRNPQELKIFVTVGTVHKYKFQRMVDLVRSVLTSRDDVIWQIGDTRSSHLPGTVHRELSEVEIARKVDWADVVITHSGVGSILNILDRGKYPIIIPRLSNYGEHVDDHQIEIASKISKLGLGLVIFDSLVRENLIDALNSKIVNKGTNFYIE